MSRQLTLLLRKHFMRNDLERPQGLSNLLRIGKKQALKKIEIVHSIFTKFFSYSTEVEKR